MNDDPARALGPEAAGVSRREFVTTAAAAAAAFMIVPRHVLGPRLSGAERPR